MEMCPEGGDSILVMDDLGYGGCKLMVGVPDSWLDVDSMSDLADLSVDMREHGRDLKIATKYPRLVERHMLRHGVSYYSLVQSSGTLEAAPAMGFADIIADISSTGTTLRENRLKTVENGTILASQACVIGNGRRLAEEPDALRETRILLEQAEAHLRARDFFSITANILGSSPETWDGGDELVLERLGQIVDYCSTRGVVLALEPHVGDGLCEQPEKVVELLRQVDSPYLRLNFDISHFEVSGIATARSVGLLAPWAAHTHVKDQRGRVPEFEFLIPGEGPFDYCDYLRRMDAAGYGGCVTAEVSMAVHRRPGYDPMEAAALCHRTLQRAFRETGLHG